MASFPARNSCAGLTTTGFDYADSFPEPNVVGVIFVAFWRVPKIDIIFSFA